MVATSAYTKLRGLAMQRGRRLEKAGFEGAPLFARASDIGSPEQLKTAITSIENWLKTPQSSVRGARAAARAATGDKSAKKLLTSLAKEARAIAKELTAAAREQQKQAAQAQRKLEAKERRKAQQKEYRERRKAAYEALSPEAKNLIADARKNKVRGITPFTVGKYAELSKDERALYKAAQTLGVDLKLEDVKDFSQYLQYRYAQEQEAQYYFFARWLGDYMEALKNDVRADQIISDFEEYKQAAAAELVQLQSGENAEMLIDVFDDVFTDLNKKYARQRDEDVWKRTARKASTSRS